MTEEEKRKYEAFQYWIQTNTERGVTTIPDNLCLFVVNLIKKLQKENEKLKNIRYDTPYGTETIHLIPESDLIEINTQKYMIEVKPGKFVDLKQVYQENKILNEYKGNYIPVQIIEDFIKNYQKLSDEFHEKFLETNRTDIDIHDAGIFCDAKVQVLQELLESEK